MLKLENVSKFYYSEESVTCALRKINLEFKIGEFVSIVGESGSGKTTLLNILSGLDSYQDGEMYYNGKQTLYFDDSDWEKYRKEEVAFIFQNYNLIDSYTVLENVMAAYLLEGYSKRQAKIKAKEKLELVGLKKDGHKRATKLSGGQKQRLAIARALAKETNIIVADEPTGNLDTKNGEQVLKLLKELSKDKLVIVVTHNQNEIEPYITRKVRLRDGEIVEDVIYQKVIDKKPLETFQTKDKFRTSLNFALLNLKSQPKKCFLMFMLMLVFVLSTFVFVTNFEANLDENKTKILTNDIFANTDERRLLVKTSEDDVITKDIMEESMVSHIVSYEKYDYILDCNYFRPGDYKWKYSGGTQSGGASDGTFTDNSSIMLENHNNFMRSTSHLTENDLAFGRLPTNPYEMVVYGDQSLVGKKEEVLFKNALIWGEDTYLKYNIEIVGVLKTKTDQAYFSDYLCKIMELSQYKPTITINYIEEQYYREYKRAMSFVKIFLDPNLENYDVSLPSSKFTTIKKASSFQDPNSIIKFKNLNIKQNLDINLTNSQNISRDGMGVSIEIFDLIYNEVSQKRQFAVFIDDYANMDKAIKALNDAGYSAISCYNASTAGYDEDKVKARFTNLALSICAVVVVSAVIVALGYAILKIKKNDYIILKMIGMKVKTASLINMLELVIYVICCSIILPIFVYYISKYTSNQYILELLRYLRVRDYIITSLISLIVVFIISFIFSKFLKTKINITELKEE